MKKKIYNTWTLLAAIFFLTTAGAQVSTYERTPGYYTFGINGGLAYQQADIPTTLEGYGLGMTLAKNLYYQPGALLSFDLRGRLLYSQTKGQDYLRSFGISDNDALNGTLNLDYTTEGGGPGFVFQNNKTDMVELGLEGVINFNKLREQTNVNLSLFGGIGVDWYNARTDQANREGLYSADYLAIDPLGSTSYVKDQLKTQILDGKYETAVNESGKLGFMPSLGVELGYQFTPRFSMGVGHKVTFTKTDLFDGHQWENNGDFTGNDDIHHYTNLHLRWIIDDNSKKLRAPIVDITNPALSPQTTRNPTFDIRASVKNISSAMDIQFTVNGYRETFEFKKEDFKSVIRLRPGNNEVVVTATNNAGSDSDIVNIIYQEPIIDNEPNYAYPTVDITNPPYDDFRTDQELFDLRAEVRNISNRNDIEVTINGQITNNFDFRNGSLSARADLIEGRNIVRIGARNRDGFAADETTIILENKVTIRPPSVDITKPSVDPYKTSNTTISIEANVYNIEDKRDIRFTIDGYESYDFTFTNNVFFANINVNNDKTVVVITATNNAGDASDSAIILWQQIEQHLDKPEVIITSTSQPTADPFDPTNCRSTVIATILNVQDRNDIEVFLNGQRFTDYDFNANTQVFKTTVRLVEGSNQIRITATNEAGYDEDTASTEGCITENNEENPPVVTITQPIDNKKVTQPKTTVKATILNITSRSDINFEVNGNRFNSFSYDKFTKVVTANITLKKGNNTVFIKAQNKDGTASDQINIIYQEIQITRPPTVTIKRPANNSIVDKPGVELIANVSNVGTKEAIDLFLNGNRINNFSYDSRKQEVSATLTLRNGNNTIRVVGTNDAGTAQDQVKVNYKLPTPKLPVVNITTPRDNSTTEKATARIQANIDNIAEKSGITFTINGRRSNAFNYQRGTFIADVKLAIGKNTMVITARNSDGEAKDQVIVNYQKPLSPPTVVITSPKDNQTFEQSTVQLTANITSVDNERSIRLTVNEKSQGFSYSKGKLIATVTLNKGRNTIKISATNKSGGDEATVSLVYTPKVEVPLPEVGFVNPAKSGGTTSIAKFTVTAFARNVTDKKDITLSMNGKPLSKVRFNTRTKQVTATVTLIAGNNSFFIEGRNEKGKDNQQSSLTYKKIEVAKFPPKVTIVSVSNPTADPFDPNKAKSTVIAKLENVKSKRSITFTFNGKNINNYSFNSKTGILQMTLDLKKGANPFEIKAVNKDGEDSANRNIPFGTDTGSGGTSSRNDHKDNKKSTGVVSRNGGSNGGNSNGTEEDKPKSRKSGGQ